MPDFFANPAGFLALLAVPAILLIHFLREKTRRLRVSTLFLLDQLAPQTPRGRKLHRLQNSLPLWLQLLIALLCTWLLIDPRWIRRESTQRIAVVLDDTASMLAARESVLTRLPEVLRERDRAAARTEWMLMTTSRPDAPIYRGTELSSALSGLTGWEPLTPGHEPNRAFTLALLHARAAGTVLFVTDRAVEGLPAGVALIALGAPIANCGFAGVRTWREGPVTRWQALVKNFSDTPQQRSWEGGPGENSRSAVDLAPGQIATLGGVFGAAKTLTLQLTGDAFALDDVLPLVAPEPKPLLVALSASGRTADAFARVLKTVPGATQVNDPTTADVVIGEVEPPAGKSGIVLAAKGTSEGRVLMQPVTAERHPWMEGLAWEGLLSAGPGTLRPQPRDVPLLWQAGEPLVFLRTREDGTRLLTLNFDVENSNATRLPALVLLLGRFLSDVAEQKLAPYAENFETFQRLTIPPSAGANAVLTVEGATTPKTNAAGTLTTPARPTLFQVRVGADTLLRGAAHFGDPREADFRPCITEIPAADLSELVREENLSRDRLAPFWLVGIALALIGSWAADTQARRL